MADDRNDDEQTLPGASMNAARVDSDHLLPEHSSAVSLGTVPARAMPTSPDALRDEIERTRERMSGTIDELDRALVRKKEQVQERLDVAAPIRQRPWMYAGGVFAGALALGMLTGGGKKRDEDEDDGEHVKVPRALLESMGVEPARGRSHDDDPRWESRARELMTVVARQEEEIRSLRGADLDEDEDAGYLSPTDARLLDDVEALGDAEITDEWDEEWNFDEGEYDEELGDSFARGELDAYARQGVDFKKPIALLLAAGVAGALGKFGRRMLDHRDEFDLDVELERSRLAGDLDRRDRAARSALLAARRDVEYGPEYTGIDADTDYDPYSTGELEVEVDLERPRGRSLAARLRRARVSPLAGAVAAGAAAAVSGMVAKLVQHRAERANELEVEVDLEEPRDFALRRAATRAPGFANRAGEEPRRATGSWTPSAHPEERIAGSSFGDAGRTGELEVEVELEGRRGRDIADPPLM